MPATILGPPEASLILGIVGGPSAAVYLAWRLWATARP